MYSKILLFFCVIRKQMITVFVYQSEASVTKSSFFSLVSCFTCQTLPEYTEVVNRSWKCKIRQGAINVSKEVTDFLTLRIENDAAMTNVV